MRLCVLERERIGGGRGVTNQAWSCECCWTRVKFWFPDYWGSCWGVLCFKGVIFELSFIWR